jgi:hypothetical protein
MVKQNEFILKIMPISNGPKDITNYLTPNYHTIIEVKDLSGKFVIEEEITKIFPQLKQVGIEDVEKGYMIYGGTLDIKKLEYLLDKWGFVINESSKHHILCNGGKVYETIKNIEQLKEENKLIEIKSLKKRLKEAVEYENYELAATIRDEIKLKES